MKNYKAMYCKMVGASERALDILIQAQKECEELYVSPKAALGKPVLSVSFGATPDSVE